MRDGGGHVGQATAMRKNPPVAAEDLEATGPPRNAGQHVSSRWQRVRPQLRLAVIGAGIGAVPLTLILEAVQFVSALKLLGWLTLTTALMFHRRGRQLLKAVLVVTAVASAVLAFSPVMRWSVDALDATVAPRQADVIVILGAGMYCGTAELNSASLARLTRGLAMWKAGFADEITISGADPKMVGRRCPSQGKVTVEFIRSLYGDSGPKTYVLPKMRTTRTEAREVARVQAARGWQTVMVVTSETHSRRARKIFRDAGVDAFVVGASEPQFDRRLRTPGDRIRAIGPVVRELAGTVKYRITS